MSDSAGAKRSELDHLSSFGSARALYHVANEGHPEGPKGVNYSRATRIDIAMKEGKVATVNVVGKADGVYLEPLPPPKPDSLQADSLRADSARTDSLRRAGGDTTRTAAPGPGRRAAPPLPADSARPVSADTTKAKPGRP